MINNKRLGVNKEKRWEEARWEVIGKRWMMEWMQEVMGLKRFSLRVIMRLQQLLKLMTMILMFMSLLYLLKIKNLTSKRKTLKATTYLSTIQTNPDPKPKVSVEAH